MLPPFIIEQIRQREDQERLRQVERPRLQLPVDAYWPPVPEGEEDDDREDDDGVDRGVVILDM